MLTKEGARYPLEHAATKPPSAGEPDVQNINFTNGRLVIEQTRRKINPLEAIYSRKIFFNPKRGGGTEIIYRERKKIRIK